MAGFHPGQFRFLIQRVLSDFDPDPALVSPSSIQIITVTVAHESLGGHYLWQDDGDPAIEKNLAYGICQMEAPAYQDALLKIQERHPGYPNRPRMDLITDLAWAILCCRHYYLCCPDPFPDHREIAELAHYYKVWWNRTGKAEERDVVRNYFRFIGEA